MQEIWSEAIKKYLDQPSTGHKGFICFKHFHQNDLIVRNEKITLKKNATPTIFNTSGQIAPIISDSPNNFSDQNHQNQPALSAKTTPAQPTQTNQIEENSHIFSGEYDAYEILKAEYSNLRQEYFELRAEKDVKISELENVIKKLIVKTKIQKEQIQYLTVKVSQKEKSTQSLKVLLKDLQTNNVLPDGALETLEVYWNQYINMFFYFIFFFTSVQLGKLASCTE